MYIPLFAISSIIQDIEKRELEWLSLRICDYSTYKTVWLLSYLNSETVVARREDIIAVVLGNSVTYKARKSSKSCANNTYAVLPAATLD